MAAVMVSSMPGDWPRTPGPDENVEDQLRIPNINTQMRQASLRVPSSASASSSRGNDELFFDTPLSTPAEVQITTPTYLVFEPNVESVERNEEVDWRRFEPPSELFRVQEGTSDELQGLIPRSIERLRTQHAEEYERRAAAARENRPLTRTTRTINKPRRNLSPIVNLDPLSELVEQTDPRINSASATSLLSNDSGYGSTPPEPTSPSASKLFVQSSPNESTPATTSKGKHKASFSFSSLFRRKDNTTFHLDIPHEHITRPSSSRGSTPSITIPSSFEVQTPVSATPEISISESSTT
ncbi:hypothetical protein EG329_012724 [Mollisiaceae sp. DMI_Dod_QoI]|nr:hypothetical protein EG329_012724 [Helotiales sp. DMI_Dod_QoI]